MSSHFKTIKDTGKDRRDLTLTSTFGGDSFGEMLQITQGLGSIVNFDEPGFIQLSIKDAYNLTISLSEWIKSSCSHRASLLQKEIAKNTALQKTIFADAVECERFISDLKVLELPIYLLEKTT